MFFKLIADKELGFNWISGSTHAGQFILIEAALYIRKLLKLHLNNNQYLLVGGFEVDFSGKQGK